MKVIKPKIHSVLKAHGGKSYLSSKIIPIMEYRPVFVEGFCYAANVALNLDEVFDKIYCFDLNPDIILVWKLLQDNSERAVNFLQNTSYDDKTFNVAKEYVERHSQEADDYWYSLMYIIKNRFSRGGLGKDFAWSERLRGGRPGDENGWINFTHKDLPRIVQKIQPWTFQCGDYMQLMSENELCYDHNIVQYLDPTYLSSSRISKKSYGKYEMTEFDHQKLLDFLSWNNNITYLSGYDSEMYKKKIGEATYSWNVVCNAGQGCIKSRRDEKLWVL